MRKVIASGMIGNGLEWYDYALYGQMALFMEGKFFPGGGDAGGFKALAVFAIGFLARPFGGLVFGWLGDKIGRNRALSLSIVMMALCTGAIGILPTYADIGIWATILLVAIRLLQGLSIGGEFSSAIVYMVEHAKPGKRGIIGSAAIISLALGFLAGSVIVSGLTTFLGKEAFQEWGWRLPFFLGTVIGVSGWFIRKFCGESPLYEEAKEGGHISESPVRDLFSGHRKTLLLAVGAYLAVTIPFYIVSVFFIQMGKLYLGFTTEQTFQTNTYCMLAMLVASPLGAWVSDKMPRKHALMMFAVVVMAAIFPLFRMFAPGAFEAAVIAEVLFAFLVGLYVSPIPALLTEMFPTGVRSTGLAVACNVGSALFGGVAPMIAKSFFEKPEWKALLESYGLTPFDGVALYLILAISVSFVSLSLYQDRSRRPLLEPACA